MKYIIVNLLLFFLIGCFDPPEISVPYFIPKSPPDSLIEHGIDAHPDNAIYIEWEEPETAEEEGILGYYVYRGKLVNQEYDFKRIATVDRNTGLLYDSDKYIDNDANLDTTYYYFLKSYNDFTVSTSTSDTVFYKLSYKSTLYEPAGDIFNNNPCFSFNYPRFNIDRINYFYFRLFFLKNGNYRVKLFLKIHRFDLSNYKYYIYLENNDSHTTVLIDSVWTNQEGNKYLEKGVYRWRIDAVSGELGGRPETEGSETDWMYFTVK